MRPWARAATGRALILPTLLCTCDRWFNLLPNCTQGDMWWGPVDVSVNVHVKLHVNAHRDIRIVIKPSFLSKTESYDIPSIAYLALARGCPSCAH